MMRDRNLPQIWEIYIATCTATGMQYVGQASRTAYARWGWTISCALTGRKTFPLHRAIREHGPHSFSIEVIAASRSQSDADWLEAELIQKYDTRMPRGYNVTGGRGALGIKLTEVQRAGRSAQSKAHWADPLKREAHTAALRASGPSRGAKIKAAYAAPELKARNRAQLDTARDRRLTGAGVRTKRTIRDRRQTEML